MVWFYVGTRKGRLIHDFCFVVILSCTFKISVVLVFVLFPSNFTKYMKIYEAFMLTKIKYNCKAESANTVIAIILKL